MGTKDRTPATTNPLSVLEEAVLKYTIKAFIKGLANPNIRREATKGLILINSLLKGLYTLANKVYRIKIEIKKLLKEDFRTKELDFYRELA